LVVPSLIWSSVGFEELKERLWQWMQNRSFPLKAWFLRRLELILLLLICVPLLSGAWAPQRKDEMDLKEVGLWLKHNRYANSIILGEDEFARLAFYADSEFVPIPKGTYQDIIKFAREKGARLLVVDKKTIDNLSPHFLDKISPTDLESINITGSKYAIIVFRLT
jgi:hypothetical protein